MRPILSLLLFACGPPELELPDLEPTDPLCATQAPADELGCTVDPDWTHEWRHCHSPFAANLHGAPDDRYTLRLEAKGDLPYLGPDVIFEGTWEGSRFEFDAPATSDGCVYLRLVVSDGTGACGVCTDHLCLPDFFPEPEPEDLVCP